MSTIERRQFLAAGAAGLGLTTVRLDADHGTAPRAPFRLRYAPHFHMFENHAKELLDQLRFAADEGFTAWEDNSLASRPVELQEQIAARMQECGIAMGVFVAHADFDQPTFASGKQDHQERVLADMHKAVEVARRARAQWCTVVPGTIDPGQDAGYQLANTIDLLKRCVEIVAPAKLTMVLEALNFRDHPRLYLTKIAQGFQICRAVGSPHCKLLDDLYHQQVSEGNLIPNIDRGWSEIAYFQIGDNPGRCEPGTGEVNWRNVFRHVHGKGFTGILGMEHGKATEGKEGERKLIDAYRQADSW